MRVLACLLNYKTPDLTQKALEKLLPEIRALPGSRICIVDNDSQDGSVEKISVGVAGLSAGDVVDVVASGRNGGYGFGNNVALRRGLSSPEPPDYFYLLNSDAFMAPGSLQALVAYLDTHPDVGIAGSYVHGIDGDPHTAAFTFPSLWSEVEGTVRLGPVTRLLARHRVPRPIPAESTDDVDWVTGASMLIRRDVLDKIGLFDETFFLYFEETDLCRRAHNAGFKVAFVREASVAHIQGATTGVTNLKRRTPGYVLDSRRWYFLKHHGRPYLWAANVAHGVGMLSFRIRRRLQNKPDPDFESALSDFIVHCLKHP